MTTRHFWVWGMGWALVSDKKIACSFVMNSLVSSSTGLKENSDFALENECKK